MTMMNAAIGVLQTEVPLPHFELLLYVLRRFKSRGMSREEATYHLEFFDKVVHPFVTPPASATPVHGHTTTSSGPLPPHSTGSSGGSSGTTGGSSNSIGSSGSSSGTSSGSGRGVIGSIGGSSSDTGSGTSGGSSKRHQRRKRQRPQQRKQRKG